MVRNLSANIKHRMQAYQLFKIKYKLVDAGAQVSWLQRLFATKFNLVVISSLAIWFILIFIYSLTYIRRARKQNQQSSLSEASAIVLVVMEFFVTFGYPIVFYKLHAELEKQLIPTVLQRVNCKLVLYFTLMSVLIVSRYIYYVVEVATIEIDPTSAEPVISQRQLIPCYISELIFSSLILFHLYEANALK